MDSQNKSQGTSAKEEILTVGLGASTGGLEAIRTFFDNLPQHPGMAFIVIMHLSPDHESNLAELLQLDTSMEVIQVTEDAEIRADQVYVIPPGKLLEIEIKDNYLVLSETDGAHGVAAIDLFFRSLAKTKAALGTCIILSGRGTDGTTGLKAVKEAGGLTMVQEPADAAYPGMPQSAISTGLADIVCPVEQMAEELQSTTEKLETSREELQSVNEKLETVNRELEDKLEKLDRANSDLKNLMEATEVGIVFVDNNFCIKSFTSVSTDIFNLLSSDKGRPIAHITHKLKHENLLEDLKRVQNDLDKIKKTVQTEDDRWYIMRMRPYRSTKNKIEGVVLSFFEVTELKKVRSIAADKLKQEALAELGIYALEHQELESIMKRAIDLSCVILDLDCAVIYALNRESGTLEIGAQAGCAKKMEPVNINEEWDIGYAFHSKDPVMVENYEEDQRFGISPFLRDEGVVSSLNVKVRSSDDTYGLLGFYSREHRTFTESEVHFVQVIANMVGMAIQNKSGRDRLETEVQRSQRYQREILENNLTERWELGSYLHDNLAQKLVAVKMLLNETEAEFDPDGDLPLIHRVVNESIENIRDLMQDILPIDIEEGGVLHALKFLVKQSRKLYEIECELEIDAVLADDITERKRSANLYFIAQEAVKNAVIHGGSDNIQVTFRRQNDKIVLSIEDNGSGLPQGPGGGDGKGLRIMKHRGDLLNGRLEIENKSKSGKERGTIVRCLIPYNALVSEEE